MGCFSFRKSFNHRNLEIILFILLLIFLLFLIYTILYRLPRLNQLKVADNYATKNIETEQKKILNWALSIPKLNVNVPVILNVDGADKKEYFKALQNGVAQMKGTALPGEGNTVIFGHSNFYGDDSGEYKNIFYNLNQLEIGDEIKILSNGKILRYLVSEIKMVEAKNIDVIKQKGKKELTLITCWPPGTIDQRLVVVANLK